MRWLAILAALALTPAHAQTNPLHAAVDAYALYQNDVTALLELDPHAQGAMDDALRRAARHGPAQVSRGWIAYGALTAAQSPAFARGVESRARAAGRAPVLRQLRRDAGYARRRPPGSAEAIQLILTAGAADGARMIAAGHRYRGVGDALAAIEASDVAARDARTAELHSLGGERRTLAPAFASRVHVAARAAAPLTNPNTFGGANFWDALAERSSPPPPSLPWAENSAQSASVNRMLTLAALHIVGASGSEDARVEALLDDPASRECLELEQLQLRQCASVSHHSGEDAYCLARHGLTGPGACFARVAQ
jgi:hypothetical protein